MNLRHIEVFREVYLAGSVSGAARALGVSQPSVSKVLRHAESRLGFVLFQRAKGRLLPTEEAHVLFREVDEVYDRVSSLQQIAQNLKRGGDGLIRIATLPSIGLELLPVAIAQFRTKFPRVSFEVRTLSPTEIIRSLHERKVDVAVCFDAPNHPRISSVLLAKGEIGLLFHSSQIPAAPDRLDLSTLSSGPIIGIAGGGPTASLYSKELERSGVEVKEIVAAQAGYVAAALVRLGVGMATVDEFTAHALMDDSLQFRPFAPAIAFKVQYLFLEERPPTGPLKSFIVVLKDVFARNGAKEAAKGPQSRGALTLSRPRGS